MEPSSDSTRRASFAWCVVLAIVLSLLALPTPTRAQRILGPDSASPDSAAMAAEPPSPTVVDPDTIDHWKTQTELTFSDASGNQDLTLLTTGLTLKHIQTDEYALEVKLEARYGRSDGQRVVERYTASIDYAFPSQDGWAPFLHTSAEHDPFRRLRLRTNTGAGAKLRLDDDAAGRKVSVSMAVLHSLESLTVDSLTGPQQTALLSLKLDGQQQVGSNVVLSATSQYQPVYDDPGDYLLSLDGRCDVKLTARLGFTVSYEFNRDSTPAPDVANDDRLLTAGLTVAL